MPEQNQKTRLKLFIAYKGTEYRGWQKQKNTATIQGTIESVFKKIFKEHIAITGAGRTDTAAHAFEQSAHCDIPSSALRNLSLQKAINSLLPPDICIRRIWIVPPTFHALHSALRKKYVYLLFTNPQPNVFKHEFMYWYPHHINLEKLQAMSRIIEGRQDFKSFQNSGTTVKSTIRTVYSARWLLLKKSILSFQIEGEGFLKQMVRNLVGTQLELSKKQQAVQKLKEIFLSKDRASAFKTAPACGLYLYKVYYPPHLDRECKKI